MIAFITNYLNIHQLPFALKMHNLLGDKFVFISTSPITETRLKMGFEDLDSKYDFVLKAYENEENLKKAEEIVETCEALIGGSVDDRYFLNRLKKGKLTFRYSERFFKEKVGVHTFLSAVKHICPFQKYNNFYYLCSSAYTAADVNKFSEFDNRTYKWGYFPAVREYDSINSIIENKKTASIMWCARMIDWKHPEAAIELAKILRQRNVEFDLNLIGDGEMFAAIQKMIIDNNLQNCVHAVGYLSSEKTRNMMELSEIFIFTSDRKEGWGAVLNESMNSGCAVVASHAIGSVPFVIEDNINGFIYEDGNIEDLANKVQFLLENPVRREAVSVNAYNTIKELWNGDVAAERLVKLVRQIIENGDCTDFDNGPCSKANILKDDWYCKK